MLNRTAAALFAAQAPFFESVPAVITYAYDPTDSNNLVLNVNKIISFLDVASGSPSATRRATQSNDALRAELVTGGSGINGLQCAQFIGANLDNYSVDNALAIYQNIGAIGMDGVIRFDSLATVNLLARILTPTANRTSFNFQVAATTGVVTFNTRRIGDDDNDTITSSLNFTAGVASFVSIQVDYNNAVVRLVIDDDEEYFNVTSPGSIVGWTTAPHTGPTQNNAASAAPTLGRVGGSALTATIGDLRLWTGNMKISSVYSRRTDMQAKFATPHRTTAFSVIPAMWQNHIYQRDGAGEAEVTVAGTVIDGGDANIQLQIIDANDGSVEVAWATMGMSSGLAWSFPLTFPSGSWKVQSRKVGEDDLDAATGTNIYGVGSRDLWIGQSNSRKWWGDDCRVVPFASATLAIALPGVGTTLNGRRWSGYGWFDPTQVTQEFEPQNATLTGEPKVNPGPLNQGCGGNGIAAYMDIMWHEVGWPSGCICYSIGGTPVSYWFDSDPGPEGYNWAFMVTPDSTGRQAITADGGPGWDFEAVSYIGGERDALDNVSFDNYVLDSRRVFSQIRALTGETTPIFISILGPNTGGGSTDENVNAIRTAQLYMIEGRSIAITGATRTNPVVLEVAANDVVSGDDVTIASVGGMTQLNGNTYTWTRVDATHASLNVDGTAFGTYTSGGTASTDQTIDLAYNPLDRSLGAGDPQHPAKGDYAQYFAPRYARTRLNVRQPGTFTNGGRGPKISSGAVINASTIELTVTHDGGTTLVDASNNAAGTGLTAFEVQVNDADRDITVAALNSGKIRLTVSGTAINVSGTTIGVRYLYGRAPDNGNIVFDNTAPYGTVTSPFTVGCPLWPTYNWFTFEVP